MTIPEHMRLRHGQRQGERVPIPDTLTGLALAGYVHSGTSECTECPATIEWFWTLTNRRMPFSLVAWTITKYEPHFASCPAAKRFSGKGRKRA